MSKKLFLIFLAFETYQISLFASSFDQGRQFSIIADQGDGVTGFRDIRTQENSYNDDGNSQSVEFYRLVDNENNIQVDNENDNDDRNSSGFYRLVINENNALIYFHENDTSTFRQNNMRLNNENDNYSAATVCDENNIVVGEIGYNLSNNQVQNNNLQARNENRVPRGYLGVTFLENNNILPGMILDPQEESSSLQVILHQNHNVQETTFNETQNATQRSLNEINEANLPENNVVRCDCKCVIQ